MKVVRLVAVLMVSVLPVAGQARILHISPAAGATLRVTVEKTRLMSGKQHNFTWSRYDGSVRFDKASPATSTAILVIEADSLQCHDTWVSEKDLQKIVEFARNEMLGLPEHGQIRFESKGLVPSPDGYTVKGDLTIRGIAKPVVFHAKPTIDGDSMWIEGGGVIRLTDYGLKPPTAALGTIGTRDEMTLYFRVLAQ